VKHKGAIVKESPGSEERLGKQKEYELRMGFDDKKIYDRFAERIEKSKNDLLTFLNQEVKKGKRVFIYGASTRGSVVLQYFGIDKKLIFGAADKNSDKWGKYIVGTGIPIMSVEEYRKQKPDYLLVLPYHFLDEIKAQEKEFLKSGGKMIIAIPSFTVISK
jgi:hypothetical protein